MKHYQQGMSFYGICLLLVLVIFFGILGFKIGPIYLDNSLMGSSVTEVLEGDLEGANRATVRDRLNRAMTINNISTEGRNALVVSKDNDKFVVTADYEVRINLFYNIDVVVSFDEQYRQP
ncbi:MAG: DUF4845 domain-containing protein [Gammaproteobacteria bacterium]|jgi:hypothetical protein|nr:DUF4845 domain-containing protein [Gammaproteobacteria bacterium]